MNEISTALRVINTTIKTVKIIDIVKRITISIAVLTVGIFAFRFFRK